MEKKKGTNWLTGMLLGLLLFSLPIPTAGALALPVQAAEMETGCPYFNTQEDAVLYLRAQLVAREPVIAFMLPYQLYQPGNSSALLQAALEHTGVGTEGDYLKWQLSGWSCQVNTARRAGLWQDTVTYEYQAEYLTDAKEEAELTETLASWEQAFKLSEAADTQDAFFRVYHAVASKVVYAQDDSLLSHTAYSAAVRQEAVCQGYVTLLYRLLLSAGIDNRIVVSDTHAWNLVDLDGQYYECDVTWDAAQTQAGKAYRYFGKASLTDAIPGDVQHIWSEEELDASVYALPRAEEDYIPAGTVSLPDQVTVLMFGTTCYGEYEPGGQSKGYGFVSGADTIQAVTVWQGLTLLTPETDYVTIVTIGKEEAKVVIQGIGAYSGQVVFSYPVKLLVPSLRSARQTGTDTVRLSWSGTPGATGYAIYRRSKTADGYTKWEHIGDAALGKTSYQDKKCKADRTYQYKIKTLYTDGKGKSIAGPASKAKTVTVRK